MKGLAGAFGLGAAVQNAAEAARRAQTLAKPGTKFCPERGAQMIQPTVDANACPKCNTPTGGAKFCPNCGAGMG
jgi:hypothetical protein